MRPLRAFLVAAALSGVWAGSALVAPAPSQAQAAGPSVASPFAAASNASADWWFSPRGTHRRPAIPASAARLLDRYGGIWIGGRHERLVYLTFDEAWEAGTTKRIVGILARADVKATFFLTGGYIRANPGLTRRLAAHGHLLGNHTSSHANMVTKAWSRSAFTSELRATERVYHAATGGTLARFFRPPFGAYSARSLQLAERLGYVTVFWSFAHYDYDDNAQPPTSVTASRILSASYPGAVYLLHASSTSNVNALATVIRGLKARGYGFATLDELR